MQDKLEKYLYKKYPKLFEDERKSMKETCMCWGCSCGDGWFLLLDRLCAFIVRHIERQHVHVERCDKWDARDIAEGRTPTERQPEEKEKIPWVKFHQVKEKFGALRIYFEGGDETIRNAVNYTEYLSVYVCEDCGKSDHTVGRTTKGWIHSICKTCAENENTDYVEDRGWVKLEELADSEKVFAEALEDRKRNKGKEMALAMLKVKEIEARDKGKKVQTRDKGKKVQTKLQK